MRHPRRREPAGWVVVASKPTDMFDQDAEWGALTRFASDTRGGATLGVVSKRRRQGKTLPLDALCKAQGGFFFEATEAADAQSPRRIGALIGEYAGSPIPARPADWHEVLDALLALGEREPTTVVIDEFPYLAKANPSPPSVIQAAFGPRREQRLRSQDPVAAARVGHVVHGALAVRHGTVARARGAGDGDADPGLQAGSPILGDHGSAAGGAAVLRGGRDPGIPGHSRGWTRAAVRRGLRHLGHRQRPRPLQPAVP
jgi:hypothetical protein